MHDKQKALERAVVLLVAVAIAANLLVAELPRLLPYLVVLAVIVGLLRLIWWYTQL